MMKRIKRILRSAASCGVRFIARETVSELRAAERFLSPVAPVRDRSARIVFVVETPEAWNSFNSTWRAFLADPECQTTVIAVTEPSYLEKVKNKPREFLVESGISFVTPDYYELAKHQPDVVFLHNPDDGLRPPSLQLAKLRRYASRVVYIPYGFEIGGGAKRVMHQFNTPVQQKAWRVFVRSDRFKRLYRKKCAAGDAHVVMSGHPMVDAVLERSRESVDAKLKNFVGKRRSILWNPHYCETRDQSDFSTFLRWKDSILDFFAATPELVLILRPHLLLFGHLAEHGLMTPGEIEQFRKRFSDSSNMIIDESADFTDAFAVSDALMSDASSFLTLYGVTNKPILYLPNPTGPGLNEEGEIVQLYYTGDSPEAIRAFVQMVGRGEDPMREKRLAGFGQFVHMPKEGAGVFIKNYVSDALRRGV